MNEQLCRKKSIDRVSSPEQLDTYIRVVNPGFWTVLLAIVVLLAGVCVWGVLGHLDTTVSASAVSEHGVVTLYAKESDIPSLKEGMKVRIQEQHCIITQIAGVPVLAQDTLSDYALHVGGFQSGEWVYVIQTDAQLPDGTYAAEIVVESVSPISFVVN